jgi:hypothetical protein
VNVLGFSIERQLAKGRVEDIHPPTMGPVGRAGTLTWAGRVYEDYKSELSGRDGCATYERMRRSDPQVGMTLRAMKLPIYQAKWDVVASEDDEELGEEIALAVKKMLFAGGPAGWRSVLRHACLMLDFGFSVLEEVWEVRDRPDYMRDLKAPPKMLWLAGLEPRLPVTVDQWLGLDKEPFKLTGIQQVLRTGGKTPPPIPAENCLIFTNEKEGDNYEGRSILRTAYKPWWYAENLEKFDAMGLERAAIGVPHIHYESLDGLTVEQATERADKVLSHLNANETGWMVTFPGQVFNLHGNEYKNDAIRSSIRAHKREISVNAIMQFMELGAESSSGSRATASEQRAPFDLAELALADEVGETIAGQTIEDIVKYNWGERPGYPSLSASGVLDTDMVDMAKIIQALATSGTLIPDDDLEDWARDMCHMPKAIRPKEQTEPQQHKRPAPVVPPEGGLEEDGDGTEEPVEGDAPKTPGGPAPAKAPGVEPGEPAVKPQPPAKPKQNALEDGGFWRAPTEAERFVAFGQIRYDLDTAKEQFLERVGATARELAGQVALSATRYVQAKNPGKLATMPAPSGQKLVSRIKGELQPLVAYGRRTVREEKARALAGSPAGSVIRARQAGDRGYAVLEGDPEDLLSDEGLVFWQTIKANHRAQAIIDAILSAAVDEGLKLIRTGSIRTETLLEVAEKIADRGVLNAAGLLISEAFGMGRGAEIADQVADGGIVAGVYSALLDNVVCDECLALDGQVFHPGEPEFEQYMDGNAENCYGGDRCRCMMFLEYADMSQPVV